LPRPPADIDIDQLEKLGALWPTVEEIADFFGVARMTMWRRMDQFPSYREALERGQSKGRLSLRRWQMKAAEGGNPTMLIWLGKQILHQKDQQEVISNVDPGLTSDAPETLSSEELRRQISVVGKKILEFNGNRTKKRNGTNGPS
jgi:hypothetical protein